MGLPRTAKIFDQVQAHVDYLSIKAHAVPTKSTDTAADAAQIIFDMVLRSGDGIPDALVVALNPKITSNIFREFNRRLGSKYHKNTNARAERVNGVLGDTLQAFGTALSALRPLRARILRPWFSRGASNAVLPLMSTT